MGIFNFFKKENIKFDDEIDELDKNFEENEGNNHDSEEEEVEGIKTRRSTSDHTKLTREKCVKCKQNLTEREIEFGTGKCSCCFFDEKKCEVCGRKIVPYADGYTKCKRCFNKCNENEDD